MKLILLLLTLLLWVPVNAHLASETLPEKSYSIQVTTGNFVERGQEKGIQRFWDGKKWHWNKNPDPQVHHVIKGQLLRVTEAGKAPILYTYDPQGRITRRDGGHGRFLELRYDDQGRVIEEKAPLGKEGTPKTLARFVYHPHATEVYDALNHKKVYHWNDEEAIHAIEHYLDQALYRVERFEWDKGQLVKQSLEDASGQELTASVSRYEEEVFHSEMQEAVLQTDSLGHVVAKTDKKGYVESYQWDQHGNLISRSTSKAGEEEHFTYDFMNRLIRESGGFSFEYDLLGQEIKRIDPEGNETDFIYDDLGRLIEMQQPCVLDPENQSIRPTTRWKYNELDQVIEKIDPDGWVTKILYEKGEATRYEHPDGSVEDILTEKKKELPQAISQETPPPLPFNDPPQDIEHVTRVINERGQKVLQKTFTDFAGLKSVRTYDALGRVEKIEKYDLLGDLFCTKEFRYTPAGLKAVEITNGHSIHWVWGAMGRLAVVTEDKGTAQEKTTRFTYDSQGRLASFIKPSGRTLFYTYDEEGGLKTLRSNEGTIDYHFVWGPEGRLASVCDQCSDTYTSRRYDEKGNLSQETLANGLTLAWEEKRLVLPDKSRIRYEKDLIVRENERGEPLYSHLYASYDPYQHLVQEDLIHDLGSVVYHRDGEQRIIAIDAPQRHEKISYEGLWLVASEVNGEKTVYEYDAHFQLKRAPTSPVEMDQDGNIVQIDGHMLSYDALGRLTAVDNTWFYTYDPFGRRISKKGPEKESFYLWDGMEEIGVADAEGIIQELKVMGAQGAVAVEINGTAWAVIKDFKSSIAELIGPSSNAPESPWSYLGKRHDPETGFIYFGARFLDPVRGTFLTPDPKGYIDGPDLHQFAKNNPLAYSDQFGHLAIMDSFKSLVKQGWNAFVRLSETINEWQGWLQNLAGLGFISQTFEDVALSALGKGFLVQAGWYKQAGQTGVFGEKEISPHVRITFNHGILNIRDHLRDNLKQICVSHGGTNVHYVFRPTHGFGWDVIKCLMVKNGYVSPEAEELIRVWRGLIEEMGGVNGGGKIVHYTHSVGGSDTWVALNHLTREEQKMFDIRTFGTATLIPDIGTFSVTNYVSKGDGVTLIGSLFSLQNYLFDTPQTKFIGSFFANGSPFCDHPFSVETYQEVLRALGQAFLTTHGG